MRFFIRVLVVFAIVMAAISALRGMFRTASQPSSEKDSQVKSTGKLMKDPVCGTYVTPDDSPAVTSGSETFYFCSEDCRDKFLATGT